MSRLSVSTDAQWFDDDQHQPIRIDTVSENDNLAKYGRIPGFIHDLGVASRFRKSNLIRLLSLLSRLNEVYVTLTLDRLISYCYATSIQEFEIITGLYKNILLISISPD